jgi:hypothetical protein
MRYVTVDVLSLITLSRWVTDQLASLYSEEEGLSQGIWPVIVHAVTSVHLTHWDDHVSKIIRRLITPICLTNYTKKTICSNLTPGTHDELLTWSLLPKRSLGPHDLKRRCYRIAFLHFLPTARLVACLLPFVWPSRPQYPKLPFIWDADAINLFSL